MKLFLFIWGKKKLQIFSKIKESGQEIGQSTFAVLLCRVHVICLRDLASLEYNNLSSCPLIKSSHSMHLTDHF